MACSTAVLAGPAPSVAGLPPVLIEEGQGAWKRQRPHISSVGAAHLHPHLRPHDAKWQDQCGGRLHVPRPHLRHGWRRWKRLWCLAHSTRRDGPELGHLGDCGRPVHHLSAQCGTHCGPPPRGQRRAGNVLRWIQILCPLRTVELGAEVQDLLARHLAVHDGGLLPGHDRIPEPFLGDEFGKACSRARHQPSNLLALFGLHSALCRGYARAECALPGSELEHHNIGRGVCAIPCSQGSHYAVVETEPELGDHYPFLHVHLSTLLVSRRVLLRGCLPTSLVYEFGADGPGGCEPGAADILTVEQSKLDDSLVQARLRGRH
mmetsp:Transcript_136068/g.322479  ORF Transcript_136068/g.322479 Transcript_136068/m.322479 type:complete len:319 (+) Transcript_136068:3059-4015(+)